MYKMAGNSIVIQVAESIIEKPERNIILIKRGENMGEILLEFLKETRIINRQAKLLIEDKNSLSSSDKEMLNKIILNTSKSLSKLGSEINL